MFTGRATALLVRIERSGHSQPEQQLSCALLLGRRQTQVDRSQIDLSTLIRPTPPVG
jgi:hypothetical protein